MTAYEYVRNAGGITFDDFYQYNTSARTCDYSKLDYTVTVTNNYAVWGEQTMMNHVLAGGTLAIVVDATKWGPYRRGIFSSCTKNLTINHAVNIVGVNIEGGYWVIRNSWGTWWGDNGYIKLALVSTLSPS